MEGINLSNKDVGAGKETRQESLEERKERLEMQNERVKSMIGMMNSDIFGYNFGEKIFTPKYAENAFRNFSVGKLGIEDALREMQVVVGNAGRVASGVGEINKDELGKRKNEKLMEAEEVAVGLLNMRDTIRITDPKGYEGYVQKVLAEHLDGDNFMCGRELYALGTQADIQKAIDEVEKRLLTSKEGEKREKKYIVGNKVIKFDVLEYLEREVEALKKCLEEKKLEEKFLENHRPVAN